ncbi:4Fe-4S binding protein [bacterium]|nr:4Fe-4S binding protein [bacterium]
MDAETQTTPHHLAPTGTVLKVEHKPLGAEGDINTHILLKGHPLPSPHREASLHHTTQPELTWRAEACIYCQQCHLACPRGCLHQTDEGMRIDKDTCTACGTCAKECPSMALEVKGIVTTAADLLHKTFKQNYTISRKIKQVTLGGGEPGMQTAFCADLLFQLSAMGIPTTLRTSGIATFENYLPLISYPAVIEYEIITIDTALHRQITGYNNETILDNLLHFSAEIPPATQLVIRTPLLQGENTPEMHLQQIGEWVQAHLPTETRWELFEPRTTCEDITPLSPEAFTEIYARTIAHYPAQQVKMFSRNGRLVQIPLP